MTKQEQMHQLKQEKGMSFSSIGNLFGISRQRVHQIISGYITTTERKRHPIKNAEINRIFEKIFRRDKFICQICGKKGTLIHHIDKNWQNNNFNNLVCLCNRCHLNLHRLKPELNPNFTTAGKHYPMPEEAKKKLSKIAFKRKRDKYGKFI